MPLELRRTIVTLLTQLRRTIVTLIVYYSAERERWREEVRGCRFYERQRGKTQGGKWRGEIGESEG